MNGLFFEVALGLCEDCQVSRCDQVEVLGAIWSVWWLPLPRQRRAVLVIGDSQAGVTGRQCVCDALKPWGWSRDCTALFSLSLCLPSVTFATETLFRVGKHEEWIPFLSKVKIHVICELMPLFGCTEWHNGCLIVEFSVVWDVAVLSPWHWAQPSSQLCWKTFPETAPNETHCSCLASQSENFWNFPSTFIKYCFIKQRKWACC